MVLHDILSSNMKKLRKRENLTQAQLAEICGLSSTFIGEIESMIKYPSPSSFEKIADGLNVKPFVLLLPEKGNWGRLDRNELLQVFSDDLKNLMIRDIDDLVEKYK